MLRVRAQHGSHCEAQLLPIALGNVASQLRAAVSQQNRVIHRGGEVRQKAEC